MTQSDIGIVEKLKACPFCSGVANGEGYTRYSRPLADTRWADGSDITEAFFVNCIKCGIANGRSGVVCGYQTKAEAIAAWNTRDPIITEMVEALEEVRDQFDFYVSAHLAKQPPDMDKAATNQEFVEMLDTLLAKVRGK